MNSIVVLNLSTQDLDLLARLKYSIEKAGYEAKEEYNADILTLVFKKEN